jgi:H+/Cl- antiporter ClcA
MAEETKPEEAPKAPETSEKVEAAPASTKKDMPPEPKWLFYILSFIVGLFGIIFGIIYMTKEGEESKKFGKICLLLGLLPMIIGCLCWIIAMVFGVGSSFLGSGVTEYSTYSY